MISTQTLREVARDLDTTLGAATGRAQVALLLTDVADELDALRAGATAAPAADDVTSDEAAVDTTVAKKPKKK